MASTFAIFSHNHQGWYNKATEKFETERTDDCEFVEPHVAQYMARALLDRFGLSTQLTVQISTTVSPSEVAARLRPEPVFKLEQAHVTETTVGCFSAEASELHWPPGVFPLNLATSLGNGMPLFRADLTPELARYLQVGGCIEVCVYND